MRTHNATGLVIDLTQPIAQPTRPVRAAIYARISQDAEGRELGVTRQQEDCRHLAEQAGYEVVAVHVENDVSASTNSRKPRPQYDAMIRAVRAGEVDVILAYSLSRLTRRVHEFLDLIDLHRETGVRIRTCVSGDPDLTTADGRGVAITLATWDAAEAERAAERTRRAKRAQAEQGLPNGGRRPYGFEPDAITHRSEEARIIRELTAAVLAGRTLRALARDLNERGLTNSTGSPWDPRRVRDVVMRPRNAGLISRGPARSGKAEIIGPAIWEPIVTEDEWRAAYDLLNDPARRTQQGTDSRWLGSSIIRCGRPVGEGDDGETCGAVMVKAQYGRSTHGSLKDHYRCADSGHLTIGAVKTDEFLRGVMVSTVRDPRVVAALTAHEGDTGRADRERRDVLTARLRTLAAEWDDDLIDTRDYNRKKDKASAELAQIEERLTRATQRAATSPVLSALDPGSAFLAAPVDVQRALVRQVIRVEVLPSPYRGAAWTSDRLLITPVVPLEEAA